MGGYAAGFGALEAGIATVLAAGEKDKHREEVKAIANTPGLDFGDIVKQALEGYGLNYKAANQLAQHLNQDNQLNLNAQLDLAMPGAREAQAKNLSAISRLFDDSAFADDTMRDAAAFGLQRGGTGYAGSGADGRRSRLSRRRRPGQYCHPGKSCFLA
jgi:hypothetical protein